MRLPNRLFSTSSSTWPLPHLGGGQFEFWPHVSRIEKIQTARYLIRPDLKFPEIS
jgi:hypothetical protein